MAPSLQCSTLSIPLAPGAGPAGRSQAPSRTAPVVRTSDLLSAWPVTVLTRRYRVYGRGSSRKAGTVLHTRCLVPCLLGQPGDKVTCRSMSDRQCVLCTYRTCAILGRRDMGVTERAASCSGLVHNLALIRPNFFVCSRSPPMRERRKLNRYLGTARRPITLRSWCRALQRQVEIKVSVVQVDSQVGGMGFRTTKLHAHCGYGSACSGAWVLNGL